MGSGLDPATLWPRSRDHQATVARYQSRMVSYEGESMMIAVSYPSFVNGVDIFTLEFESVVDTRKIGEGCYKIVPVKARVSTHFSYL
ncbi:hypothetical protein AVEN_165754-1 [Araneus ventricosus]|uniref:Uncharacterized protein n=1 Tax=Araneus ventricosus TaxID=182803 RepID=A0A4Y2SAF9_ARAVE|nr:hypothetical protein AVEN_165754-1 [Araneus ventricosus]